MALDDGQKIADIFETCYSKDTNEFQWDKLKLSDFQTILEEMAKHDKLDFKQAGCTAEYRAGSQEIAAGVLTIMMGEYTGRLLAIKAEQGHCDKDKPSPMHAKMLSAFRASLEKLVEQIKAREKDLEPDQPCKSNPKE